jgi:hypothetical protein
MTWRQLVREQFNLDAETEWRDSYHWSQSMKRGILLEGTFSGIVTAYITYTEGKGFKWEMRGNPMWITTCDDKAYHETITSCKQDALEYAIALLHQAHRKLVDDTHLHVYFGTEVKESCKIEGA